MSISPFLRCNCVFMYVARCKCKFIRVSMCLCVYVEIYICMYWFLLALPQLPFYTFSLHKQTNQCLIAIFFPSLSSSMRRAKCRAKCTNSRQMPDKYKAEREKLGKKIPITDFDYSRRQTSKMNNESLYYLSVSRITLTTTIK